MSSSGFEKMRHALGVHGYTHTGGTRWKKPYRNHFVAGGEDIAVWDDLVTKGFAVGRPGNEITGGGPVYFVTEAGRAAALDGISFKKTWGYGTPTNP